MIEKEFKDYIDNKYPSFLKQFIKKISLPPIISLAFISIFLYIIHFIISYINGDYEKFVKDWATPLGVFAGFYLFAVYLYLEKQIKNYSAVFRHITELNDEVFQKFYEKYIFLAVRSHNLILFCIVIIILVNIIAIRMGLWYDSFISNSWLLIEMNITVLGGLLNCWLMVCTSWMISELGKNPRISPFHNDRFGGLKAYGDLSFTFFIFAIAIATLLTVILLFAPWKNSLILHGTIMSIIIYSIIFVSFFVPLFNIHKKIKRFKETKLFEIHKLLLNYDKEMIKNLENNSDPNDFKNKLDCILLFQSKVCKIKTWPFGYTTLTKVIGGTLLPLTSILTHLGTIKSILENFS
ncbi:Uncharacterised protein [uncultured archaeon]|nr:Uncharacterised protein [uncultured archaeon]